MAEDIEEASGTIYTHVHCPYCDEVCEFEGDIADETHKCLWCDKEFSVRMT